MMKNQNEVPQSEPLRHGWGGDLSKRDAVLKDRAEEEVEKGLNPNKFAPDPAIGQEDYDLLSLMEKGQRSPCRKNK